MRKDYEKDWHDQTGQSSVKQGLTDLEERAKSLIQEILGTCQMLRSRKDHGLELSISSLCHELGAVKDLIIQAMEAMKFNAQKLEGQHLNSPDEELRLKRAAEIAWAEVERLIQFIQEIDRAIAIADETMCESDIESEHRALRKERERFNDMDLESILAMFDVIRDISSTTDDTIISPDRPGLFDQELSSTYNPTPPLLGAATSSGLEASLRKVPEPSTRDVKIHADPYTRGLYMNDAYSGRVELNYDPYDPVAGPMATQALYGGPILAQAGFDGSYAAYEPGGLSASFQPGTFGV